MMEQRESKSVRILDLIEASGDAGMRFTDIQSALWHMTHLRPFTRELRGYWCTNLYGGPFYHPGLLNFYCEKNGAGCWVRKRGIPHGGHPWTNMRYTKRNADGRLMLHWRPQPAKK